VALTGHLVQGRGTHAHGQRRAATARTSTGPTY
jgi:hypothetical protein